MSFITGLGTPAGITLCYVEMTAPASTRSLRLLSIGLPLGRGDFYRDATRHSSLD
jgi:hypothetical protein